MKKGFLLNADISTAIARLGHMDSLTIADAGLPIPDTCQRIDLALTPGVPSFLQTVESVLLEMAVESVVVANELPEVSPELFKSLQQCLAAEEQRSGRSIPVTFVPHEQFKAQTQDSKAVIRSGEFTPYANVILQSGVVF